MEITDNFGIISIEGLEQFNKKLQGLRLDGTGFERRLHGAIKKILGEARAHLREDAQSGLQMKSDPRNAYQAVRFAVYKRLFGGNVNILQSRRAGGNVTTYITPRKVRTSNRGGNRRPKTARDLDKYEGMARGFVLRFLNVGTKGRYSGYGRNGRNQAQYDRYILKTNGRGWRGKIKARNWFGDASNKELQQASGQLQKLIDKIIFDEFV